MNIGEDRARTDRGPTRTDVSTWHAPLPDFLLNRRLDEVDVIGRALVLALVIGLGMRRVANQVNVPLTSARGLATVIPHTCPSADAATLAVAVHLDPTPVLVEGEAETTAMQALGRRLPARCRRSGHRTQRLRGFWSLISAVGRWPPTKAARDVATQSRFDGAILVRGGRHEFRATRSHRPAPLPHRSRRH